MTSRHIRRFVPPWCDESKYTFCRAQIKPATRIATITELDTAAIADLGTPLRNISTWVGDTAIGQVSATLDLCRLCLRRVHVLCSWEEDPLGCLAQHAALVGDIRIPQERIHARAELAAVAAVIAANRDTYNEILRREKMLYTLQGDRP